MTTLAATAGTTPETPADLVALDRRACLSLVEFVRRAWPHTDTAEYKHNWHIELVCWHLDQVARGKVKTLVINVPPGTMKSRLCGVLAPAWIWTWWPQCRMFFASYSDQLTIRDSVARRNLMTSEWYRERWGDRVQFAHDQNLKTRYSNLAGGEMIASSVGGSGLGEHPHISFCDDLVKPDEAFSDVSRQSAIDWMRFTLSTRGKIHNSARVFIGQRLHEEDPPGYVIANENPTVVCLPMEFEAAHPHRCKYDPRTKEGELLWPAAFPAEAVAQLKKSLGPLMAPGQLQQRPASIEGGMFKRAWLRHYDWNERDGVYMLKLAGDRVRAAAKQDTWRMVVADTAMTTREWSDYTAIGVIDVIAGTRDMLVVDLIRERMEAPDVEDVLQRVVRERKPAVIVVESKMNGLAVIQRFRRQGLPIREAEADKDKVSRAILLQAMVEGEHVFFNPDANWYAQMVEELCSFPNSKHDDMVDMLAYGARYVQDHELWHKPKPPELPANSIGKLLGHDKIWSQAARRKNDPFALPPVRRDF